MVQMFLFFENFENLFQPIIYSFYIMVLVHQLEEDIVVSVVLKLILVKIHIQSR